MWVGNEISYTVWCRENKTDDGAGRDTLRTVFQLMTDGADVAARLSASAYGDLIWCQDVRDTSTHG